MSNIRVVLSDTSATQVIGYGSRYGGGVVVLTGYTDMKKAKNEFRLYRRDHVGKRATYMALWPHALPMYVRNRHKNRQLWRFYGTTKNVEGFVFEGGKLKATGRLAAFLEHHPANRKYVPVEPFKIDWREAVRNELPPRNWDNMKKDWDELNPGVPFPMEQFEKTFQGFLDGIKKFPYTGDKQ